MRYVENASLPMKGNREDHNELKKVFDHFRYERGLDQITEQEEIYFVLLDTWNYFKARYCDIIKRVLNLEGGSTHLIKQSFTKICECSGIPADKIIKDASNSISGELLPF